MHGEMLILIQISLSPNLNVANCKMLANHQIYASPIFVVIQYIVVLKKDIKKYYQGQAGHCGPED